MAEAANKKIIYFSAEYGLADPARGAPPIYAGGLGILAGDILKDASDLDVPLIGIGLLYREGFFTQKLDENGWQQELYPSWNPSDYGLVTTDILVRVPFPGRDIFLKVWHLEVNGTPLYLLDADVSQNQAPDRDLTTRLYTGDWNLHLPQEVLLGIGGVELVRALGIEVELWHLNDDHATFSLLWRLAKNIKDGQRWDEALESVRKKTVFTTHTPVKGAESAFARQTVGPLLETIFGEEIGSKVFALGEVEREGERLFSLTKVAMNLSRTRNAVSARHHQTSTQLWPEFSFEFVTNGVNASNWVSPSMDRLFCRYLDPDWQKKVENANLWQKVYQIPDKDLWRARLEAKKALIDYLSQFRPSLWEGEIKPDSLFIGFARRFAPYKQPQVLISSLDHLKAFLINPEFPVHLFMAGKAHPIDDVGKTLLQQVYQADHDPVVGDHLIFCENYDITLAKYLTSGVDIWLNTPRPPLEASGTSGMKALLNGVLNASTLDGWWYEAFNGENGWVIGSMNPSETAKLSPEEINDLLFYLLQQEIAPLFYQRENGIPKAWLAKVKNALASGAPKFNTRRVLKDYQQKVYYSAK